MSTITTTGTGSATTFTGTADSLLSAKRSVLPAQQLGQMDFLRLLTTQLQTQDPFQPMDNSQMVAQMATITNSSGIAEMNANLRSIQTQLADSRLGGAASWIGHSMLVTSNIAAPDRAGNYMGQITLPQPASSVQVDLLDGNNQVVKTIDLGARAAGDAEFYWDGTDGAGNSIANTPLQVRVRGASPSAISTWASIAAVQSPADGSSTMLITPLGSYAPSAALKLA